MDENKIHLLNKIFNNETIRTVWDEYDEKYYISIIDIVSIISESKDGRKYWNKLKQRLKEEGNETVTNCHQLKLKAKDGKYRMTDVCDIAKTERPKGFNENMSVAKRGGEVANDARKSYEKQTKKSAISRENALNYKYIDDKKLIEDKN